jgi:hypothetical protein
MSTEPTKIPPWVREMPNPVQQNPKMDNGASGDWNKRPKKGS